MMKFTLRLIFQILFFLCVTSCIPKEKSEEVKPHKKDLFISANKAEYIVNKAIKSHGGELYNKASYVFTFRNKEYTFTNNGGNYKYTVEDKNEKILDVLKNGSFTRFLNGDTLKIAKAEEVKFSEALNSVIYFATLPHKLNDTAVVKSYEGSTTIKGNSYEIVAVTFKEEGGGADFEDQYYYWINKETFTMDYLAYSFKVNGGGVRFRSSYNRRNIGGILFQDYRNYKAERNTPLKELPYLFEQNNLISVSQIETEKIRVMQ